MRSACLAEAVDFSVFYSRARGSRGIVARCNMRGAMRRRRRKETTGHAVLRYADRPWAVIRMGEVGLRWLSSCIQRVCLVARVVMIPAPWSPVPVIT